jgi:aryl-alcohol dehydrogenase-like predicted oxidoreductase
MIYHDFKDGLRLSVIGLGGHEFPAEGGIKGFTTHWPQAVQPGIILEGFGGPVRRQLVATALEKGVNFFDVTMDSEKEALGRNLREIRPSTEFFIQTRPEGMGYGYDPANAKMVQFDLLRNELLRALKLLGRERIDFYNIPFNQGALAADPEYLDKIGDHLRRLKQEGLLRYASGDTFSGEEVYLRQLESGHFDSLAMNFSLLDRAALQRVIPLARAKGTAVITREVFAKGALFRMAEAAGIKDKGLVARLGLRWNLNQAGVALVLLGAVDAAMLEENLKVLERLEWNGEDQALLERIQAGEEFRKELKSKERFFLEHTEGR